MEKKKFWAVACKALLAVVVVVCSFASCGDFSHSEELDETVEQRRTTVDNYKGTITIGDGEVIGTLFKNDVEEGKIVIPITQSWEKDNYESAAINGVILTGANADGIGRYSIEDGNILNFNAPSDGKTIAEKFVRLQLKEVSYVTAYNDEMNPNPNEGETRRVQTTGKVSYVYELTINGLPVDKKNFDQVCTMQRYTTDSTPVDPEVVHYEWDQSSARRIINSNGTEDLSVDQLAVYSDGTKNLAQTYYYTLHWNVATIGLGTHTVNDFTVAQGSGSLTKGSVRSVPSTNLSWAVQECADVYASTTALNGGSAHPSYTFTHQGATVTAHGVSYTFPILDGNFAEAGTTATRTGTSGEYILANLENNVTLSYDVINAGYRENGVLQMKNVVTVVVGDYSFTTTNTANTATISYTETDSEGNVLNINSRCVAPRSIEVLTNWTSFEENTTSNTNGVSVESSQSENKTMTDGNVVWTYVQTTTIYMTKTTLNGSTQRNAVKVVESNDFVATYKGVTKDFGHYNPNMVADGGRVEYSRETSEGSVYKHINTFTYSFNSNVQSVEALGSIVTEKPITPTFPEMGLLKNADFTATLLEGYQTWGIGGAFNCTNGTVCVWTDKNVSNLNVFQSDLVSTVYNSTTWDPSKNTYAPTKAVDGSKMMSWCNNAGQAVNAVAYTTAQTYHFNNNHNTVVNNRLKKTIDNKTTRSGKKYQIVQIIDTENSNKVLATWTFCE